jgi:Zn-finger nucleic acid-binding protein
MKRQYADEVAVAMLTCIECRAVWLDGSERWRIYLTEDEPREAVVYCRRCAQREFGPFASP